MERRFRIGFMNIIKWLSAGIIVMGSIWSQYYALLICLAFPLIIEATTLITIFDREQRLDFFKKEG
jgi:hypothetical protein